MFHCSLARQCLWSLPGEVLFKSLPQNARPVSPTGPLFCSKGGYITAIHWINYITDSCLRGTLLLSDKWAVWLICYYSKDLYSPSIHQSWLHHLMSLRSWRQQGVWTIQRFILSFFYFLLQKVILYSWILYCAVDMSAGICWLTWLSCWLILTIISNEASFWSTCWLDRRPICWHKGAFSSEDPRNLWLCLVCLVNNFNLPLWSCMYTPNWSICVILHLKKQKWQIYAKIVHFITCSTPDLWM